LDGGQHPSKTTKVRRFLAFGLLITIEANQASKYLAIQRDFEDIGAMSNRKRPNQTQYNSTCMLASINENIENVGPEKYVKIG
jgi:hypothetical protein